CARPGGTISRRGAEPCGCGRDGVRSRRGPRGRRCAHLGTRAQGLSPPAERAWRPPRKARTRRRGPRGVRARGIAHTKRPRAPAAPRARCRVRSRVSTTAAAVTARRSRWVVVPPSSRGGRHLVPHVRRPGVSIGRRSVRLPGERREGATMIHHPVVSQDEWLAARIPLLSKEKEFTRLRDELSRQRRALPWVRVEKPYVFDGPDGKLTLAELFSGRSQLIVYHFMFGPGWEEGCKSCSFLADHFDGSVVHLAHRDVTLIAVSRAPIQQIEAFKKRMGWCFTWVSSNGNDFNFDYHVSFTRDEMAKGAVYYNYHMGEFPSDEAPGLSVFSRDENGDIFHTYSSYARGLDVLVGAYNYLDLVPNGRDDDGLAFTMAWARPRHRHDDHYAVDATEPYVPPKASEAVIRGLIEQRAQAVRAKDVDAVMSHYAPDLVSFDLAPPLELRGPAANRRS